MTLFISCSPKDKNISLVKKEFNAYVQRTFDDPGSLREIVEISPYDTISRESIRGLINISNEGIEQYKELWHLKDSLNSEQMQSILKEPTPKRQPTYSEAVHGSLLINECKSFDYKKAEAKIELYSLQSRLLEELDKGLVYHPAIYVYEIKYRNLLKDGLKLESAYAYIDSLAGFKAILPEKNYNTSIISEDYYNVFQKCKECLIATDKIQELYEKQKEKWDELIEFTQRFR